MKHIVRALLAFVPPSFGRGSRCSSRSSHCGIMHMVNEEEMAAMAKYLSGLTP
jgi:hypothetical protein